jgi:hypothetical protein
MRDVLREWLVRPCRRRGDDASPAAQLDPDIVSTPRGHQQESVALRVLGNNLPLDRADVGQRVLVVGRQQVGQDIFHRLDCQRPFGEVRGARRRQDIGALANMHDEAVPVRLEDRGDEGFNR